MALGSLGAWLNEDEYLISFGFPFPFLLSFLPFPSSPNQDVIKYLKLSSLTQGINWNKKHYIVAEFTFLPDSTFSPTSASHTPHPPLGPGVDTDKWGLVDTLTLHSKELCTSQVKFYKVYICKLYPNPSECLNQEIIWNSDLYKVSFIRSRIRNHLPLPCFHTSWWRLKCSLFQRK